MSNVKVNSKTGQVAIAHGTEPRADAVSIYNAGDYKFNPIKGQIAVPTADGTYEIHDLTKEQVSALQSPDALLRKQTGMVGSGVGERQASGLESGLRGVHQGLTLNLADEIGGAAAAGLATMNGGQAPKDPAHPVTGGMSADYWANYLNQVGQERAANREAQESNPKIFKSTRLAGSIIPSAAIPAGSLPGAIFGGAAQGAVAGAGGADTQDWKTMLMQSGIGAGAGAAGGALGAAGNKILASNTPEGMAYNAIDQASPNGIKTLAGDTARSGGSPAEQSNVLADTLRNYSEQAPKQAAGLVDSANGRMAAVNQQAVKAVDRLLSPENAALLTQKIEQDAAAANKANYAAAFQNPALASPTPNISSETALADVLSGVQKLAERQGRPVPGKMQLAPDPLGVRGDLNYRQPHDAWSGYSVQDLEQMQRSLSKLADKAYAGTSEQTAFGPVYSDASRQIKALVDEMEPKLPAAREAAAKAFSQADAVKKGSQWLDPKIESVQVAAEFNTLSKEDQKAALAGVTTRLRAVLASKGSTANLGAVFDKTGLADKLVAVGFPQATVDKIVKGGMSARAVVNALQGGSDTAQKLLAAEAGKSPMSKVTAKDLMLAALTNVPTMGAVKGMNMVGAHVEKGAAENIVTALGSQGAEELKALLRIAPQRFGPLVNIFMRSAGVNNAPSIFPGGGRQ